MRGWTTKLRPDLLKKAIEGTKAHGVESCVTRHGNRECNCRPNREPWLRCRTCEWVTQHRRVGRNNLFACMSCETERVFGAVIESTPKKAESNGLVDPIPWRGVN